MEYQDKLDLLLEKSYGDLDMSWEEICEELELDVSPVTLRKSWLGCEFGGRAVYERLKDAQLDGYASDEQIEKFEKIKDEVFKERVKLQDQRREYNKILREEARFEHLRDLMIEAIRDLEPLNFDYQPKKHDNGKSAILDISDIHLGARCDNVLNYYDIDVAKTRLNILLNKTIDAIHTNNIDDLRVNLLGDLVSGFIHVQSRIEAEEDVISQIVTCSEVLSNFIVELSKHTNVKVYGVVGNHSRANANKRENMPAENFERLIFEYINLRCPNIKVMMNGLEDWQTYKIGDKEIFISHGDKDSVVNAKQHCVDLIGRVVDEIHLGHIHHVNILNDNDVSIVVNGSVMGADSYAVGIRKKTKPYQVLRIYDGDDFITYELTLNA